MARGLLNDPWILFLDEPTLGLDVAAARSIRELVLDWKAAVPGRTVLLTTHYMAEADELCERIAIVDHGRILAIGTPDELKQRVQRESIFRLELDRLDGGRGAARPAARRRVRRRSPRTTDAGGPAGRRQPRPRPTTRRWAAWSPRSAASGRTSSPCASRSPRSRTCSSSSSGAASATRRHGGPGRHRPTAGRRRHDGADGRRDADAEEAPDRCRDLAWRRPPARGSRVGLDAPPGRSSNNLRSIVGRAYPRVRGMVREPSWLFFEILLPFLTTAAFVLVYRALQAPEAYVGFVVLGGAMAAFWLNVVWMMAGQLYWEKSQGNLELYFAAPMNLMAILLGMAVGGLVMSSTPGGRGPRRLARSCSA